MDAAHDSWLKSSHRAVATCNDCHLDPHPVGRWVTKAKSGFLHSLAFTTNEFPDPIRIRPSSLRTTERACMSCHAALMTHHAPLSVRRGESNCTHCHRAVGHGAR